MNIRGNNLTTKENELLSEDRFDENRNIDYRFAGAVKLENLEAISQYYFDHDCLKNEPGTLCVFQLRVLLSLLSTVSTDAGMNKETEDFALIITIAVPRIIRSSVPVSPSGKPVRPSFHLSFGTHLSKRSFHSRTGNTNT